MTGTDYWTKALFKVGERILSDSYNVNGEFVLISSG